MLESFNIIKERLEARDYNTIQFLPTRRSLAVGREIYVYNSFFKKKTPCLFYSTCFYGLYHKIFKKKNPELYKLYEICFENKSADAEFLFEIFKKEEIDGFIKKGIITKEEKNYKFNFRFVPFEKLFLVGKVNTEDEQYAHMNYDSVTFVEFIRKIGLKKDYKRALEVGCGAGFVSIETAKKAGLMDSIDINPHAVEIMNINAKLNNISNINAFFSDCYQNINKKYDLIISDPPFEVMPDEEKNILHRYGGFLGMEIALKIFAGFDEHLQNNGEGIVFTNSYIRNFREDTLKDALFNMFKDKKFELTFYPISYQINPDFYSVYRKNKITYSIGYVIHVKRSDSFKMNMIPLNFFQRTKEFLRLCYLYLVVFLKK